jgi:hypothetical protein
MLVAPTSALASSFVVTVTSDGCFSLLIGAEVGDILFLSLSLSCVGLLSTMRYGMIRSSEESILRRVKRREEKRREEKRREENNKHNDGVSIVDTLDVMVMGVTDSAVKTTSVLRSSFCAQRKGQYAYQYLVQ